MKRTAIFVTVFVLVYIGSCYLVPGWRIKLEAPPLAYFAASLQSMMLVKGALAAAVAAAAAAILGRRSDAV